MRIVIDLGAADDPDAHGWLDRILYRVEDGWHVWDLSESPDPDVFRNTPWIRSRGVQGEWVCKLLVASIQRDGWAPAHGRRVHVTPHPTGSAELEPEPAFRLADEPLVILVENRNSDGGFIERVVKELDKPLHDLWKCDGEPIRFDSVGGAGEMRREVEKRANAVPYRPRLVAIIDSDRKGPKDPESVKARQLREVCDQHGLPCWVLAKREAENYLPHILLCAMPDAGSQHKKRVEAWNRLSDDQKDFFDMKRGLPDASSPNKQELFDGLRDADRGILSEGFGKNVHKCWNQRHEWDVEDELLARGRGDLERGIALIRKEL